MFRGHVQRVEHRYVEIVERHFAVLQHVEFTMLKAKVLATAKEERIVGIIVGVAVAAAVVDERVVEQSAVGFGGGG